MSACAKIIGTEFDDFYAETGEFSEVFAGFQSNGSPLGRNTPAYPVFLLAGKLTMNEIGADNLVICHTQTIEPLIRTFQRG